GSSRTSHGASGRAASRCGTTTSSKLSPPAESVAGRGTPLLMQRSEDLLDALLERGIAEPEAGPAQPDVRERRVGSDVVGQGTIDQESGRGCRNAPDAQGTVREAGDRLRELAHLDGLVVGEE